MFKPIEIVSFGGEQVSVKGKDVAGYSLSNLEFSYTDPSNVDVIKRTLEDDPDQILDVKCENAFAEVRVNAIKTGTECEHVFLVPCSACDQSSEPTISPTPGISTELEDPLCQSIDNFSIIDADMNPFELNHYENSSDSICHIEDMSSLIEITSCNDQITAKFHQKWKGCDDSSDSISWMRVIENNSGVLNCLDKIVNVPYGYTIEHGLTCGEDGKAHMSVAVHDGQFDEHNAQNPGVCNGWPSNGKNSNVMLLNIEVDCASINAGRRMDEESFENERLTEPSDDEEDAPYCASVDYPCEGDEPDMVYICHYSPRSGYQSFCVPEADSDLLSFYPHDYCGPCEGGFGNEQTRN